MYMALYIQDPETDQLARQLSAATGEIITQAVNAALRERLSAIAPSRTMEKRIARIQEAFRQYGRGRHPAGLNFGNCFSYALARSTGEPLLFKGLDFARTDIAPA
jgi:ribonuclease VapC